MKNNLKKVFGGWGPVFLWAGLIFYVSSLSAPPPSPYPWLEFALPYLAHFLEFSVLFLLIYRATLNFSLSFFLTLLYAISDEFHQSFIPSRTPSLADFGVDFLGIITAWLFLGPFWSKIPAKLKRFVKKEEVEKN